MYSRCLTALLVFFALVAVPASAAGPSASWQEHPGNPVLAPGSPGAWDDSYVMSVSVAYDGSLYHMWYTGSQYSASEQIGYATSPDGLHWTRRGGGPVLRAGTPGSWDDGSVSSPSVLRDGNLWKMWYCGSKSGRGYSGIGYATSADGINWTKSANNPVLTASAGWENSAVYRPSVLLRTGVYHMWYSTFGSAIGYAHSTDGEHWTKSPSNPVLTTGSTGAWDHSSVNAPTVVFVAGEFHMWYQGSAAAGSVAAFGHATGADPEHWSKDSANPVLRAGAPGSWDGVAIAYPSVVYSAGKFHMWFHGKASSQVNTPLRVGYADSAGPDLPPGHSVFLPFISVPPPVPPAAPRLDSISNPMQSSSYIVSWGAVPGATSYALRENGSVTYEGADPQYQVSWKPQGHYCYDVTAANSAGVSAVSNTECTDVAASSAFTPKEGVWGNSVGSQWFTVSGGRLTNAGIRVNTACGTLTVEVYPSAGIINPTDHSYSWGNGGVYGSGVFTSETTATGKMGLAMFYAPGCGYVSAGPFDTTYSWRNAALADQAAPVDQAVGRAIGEPQSGDFSMAGE